MWMEILITLILFFFIPLLLKIRDYLYRKKNLVVGGYEDPLFCLGLFFALLIHSALTNSELTACMSSAPMGYFSFLLYKIFWKRR